MPLLPSCRLLRSSCPQYTSSLSQVVAQESFPQGNADNRRDTQPQKSEGRQTLASSKARAWGIAIRSEPHRFCRSLPIPFASPREQFSKESELPGTCRMPVGPAKSTGIVAAAHQMSNVPDLPVTSYCIRIFGLLMATGECRLAHRCTHHRAIRYTVRGSCTLANRNDRSQSVGTTVIVSGITPSTSLTRSAANCAEAPLPVH